MCSGIDQRQADGLVGDHRGDKLQAAGCGSLQVGEARHRLDRVVGRRPPRVGTFVGIAVGRTEDDVGLDRADRLVVETEPLHRARSKVRQDDIGTHDQPPCRFPAGRGFDVERKASLVAVELNEGVAHRRRALRQHMPEHIPGRRLQLDYVCAKITENLTRQRSHSKRRHVDDAKACEWTALQGWL
jgi:hypothetical protein